MSGQVREDGVLAKAVVIDGRKEWYCRSGSETNVWTKTKCRRCKTDIPSGLQGKPLQAVSTKRGRSWSASSSWVWRRPYAGVQSRAQEAELRELRDKVQKTESAWKEPAVQFEEADEEIKPDEDCKTEGDCEANSRKKLDLRRREATKQLRKIEEIADLVKGFAESQKEKWQRELLHVERRWNDLLLEHVQMQKMSRKLQSLQDKKMQCLKNAGK